MNDQQKNLITMFWDGMKAQAQAAGLDLSKVDPKAMAEALQDPAADFARTQKVPYQEALDALRAANPWKATP